MPQFSQRASQLTSSLIREILAATQQPGVISFAGGLPATDLLPKLNWSSVPFDTEQYGMSEGEPALREAIARDAQKLGIRCTKDQVLVLSGSQQALDLVSKLFIDPATPVAMEAPTYLAALQSFRFFGADIRGLPVVDRGAVYAIGHSGRMVAIDERIGLATRRIRAGNLYINRNLIGAVVGVQPFGGEGRSGTGPKAGGPFYLPRLMGDLSVPPAALGLTPDDSGVDDCRLARFDTLRAWAHHEGLRDLAEACADFATTSPLACRATLPGPTGERNTLGFAPRGTILCVADDRDTLLVQLAAALATGNTPAVVHGAVAAAALDALPDGLAAAVVQIDEDAILTVDGVLHASSPERRTDLHRRLADHPARILPLVEAGPDGRYPLYRLVVERAVSINTAAAGGNTSLMTLAV